ncbi:MAG: hypothetical protein ACK5LT_06320 [Lachnospirales bacterium]
MKRLIALLTTMALIVQPIYALSDRNIFTDTINKTYIGSTNSGDLINNINFDDLDNKYGKDIGKMGALNIIKAYDDIFKVNEKVKNKEAIAYMVRLLGMEEDALQAAQNTTAEYNNLEDAWYDGYFQIAQGLGLIDAVQYGTATAVDDSQLDPKTNFLRDEPVSREDLASWIGQTMIIANPASFFLNEEVQSIYSYSDWRKIDVADAPYVQLVSAHNIMGGGETFNPKDSLTNGYMAKVLANLDQIYYTTKGYIEVNGTVGGTKDLSSTTTNKYNKTVDKYIRNENGLIDVIRFQGNKDNAPQSKNMDVPTYLNEDIVSLQHLKEGYNVEYVVDPATNTALYIEVVEDALDLKEVAGDLSSVNTETGEIVIKDSHNNDNFRTFKMVDGIYNNEDGGNLYVYNFDGTKGWEKASLPIGSKVTLNLKNNIVDRITYIGQEALITENRGIVVENNKDFGYLIVYDNTGQKVIYNYLNDVTVEKQEYYDLDDEVGYIDSVFPNFQYDPRDTQMSSIETGDIVYIRPIEKDGEIYIESISASTNYTMKYGKIKAYTITEDIVNLTMEFEDGSTKMYTYPTSIYLSEDGNAKDAYSVQAGDYGKILLNIGILAPGNTLESVKEVYIEGNDRNIDEILKCQVAGIDTIQGNLMVQNALSLKVNGWQNYSEIRELPIKNNNTEIYHNGNRVSYDYATKFLKRTNGEVYIAMENSYTGPSIKKVSFYDGRDSFIPSDTIVEATSNSIVLSNNNKNLNTSQSTIVVRNGRLVNENNLMPYDYAKVAVNGGKAAVVEVTPRSVNTGLLTVRGRIKSVNNGENFTVQSMAIFENDKWIYTPVERTFQIDYNTTFINGEGGTYSYTEFIDYTDGTVVDSVYNVVANGTHADYVVSSPYAKNIIIGDIYNIEDATVYLSNVYYLDENNTWAKVSNKNNTAVVTIDPTTVFIKNSNVVNINQFKVGESIRIATDFLDDKSTLENEIGPNMPITGYFIFGE